jgi:hypothetical protein
VSAADPRAPAIDPDPWSTAQDAIIGLAAEAAASTVVAYFAAFAWDATLDPMSMSAESFIGAALAQFPR